MPPEDRDERDPPQSIIHDFLEAENHGKNVDQMALIASNPEHADSLREFFQSRDRMNENPYQSSGSISAEIPTVTASLWKRPAFIVGITLTLIAFLFLPLGFRTAPLGVVFRLWRPDNLPAFARLFVLWSPVVFAIGLVIIGVGTPASATRCALAIALVALAAIARPFMAPQLCGMVALVTSMIGFALTVYDRGDNEPVFLRTLSVLAHALVAILAVLLLAGALRRHVIDILERGYGVALVAIGLAPIAALILLAVACIQAERRGQRAAKGQISPAPADR